ncbi:hypothetical protein C1645_833032 [Glomus cerebriforme]|uniref:BTB/POZ protein n=1 Tax=Glomus cerebriforme TaxID=658196 RepID=A0A397SCC9_9GLOM|nr:hypothetical protein C1645_833032 [Glomus cerebriforme]
MLLVLHEAFKRFFFIINDSDDYNVIIQVGKNKDMKEFRAHSIILRARSPYLKSAFSSGWITKKDDVIMFNKPNITSIVFDMVLKYIYTGELDLTKYQGENIFGLLVASDELLIDELFNHVQDYLIEKQAIWKLQDYCLVFICSNPQPFITSDHFTSLDKDILYGLLKRDDLRIEEVVVWNWLIKWGIEQTHGLGNENNDKTKWNNKNYEALKKTLNQFIPLVRFMEISPDDYFDKVRPYKTIIPNHIYEEIEKFYIKGTLPRTTNLSPRTGMIQSKIIKPKLSSIIINWINEKDCNHINNSFYSFNLFYYKSHDGNNNIRNRCTEQEGAILILIKTKCLIKIFGGYNPVGWSNKNQCFISTNKSFIFSFENDEDTKNMKISRVTKPSYAIYNYSNYDEWGGWKDMDDINFGKGDLKLKNDYLSLSYSGNYEKLNKDGSEYRNEAYEVEEIEAFDVVKKSR